MQRMRESILLLPGDGIGPEVMSSAEAVLDEIGGFEYRRGLIGGQAMAAHDGDPFPPETARLVQEHDTILLGAVGDPAHESTDPEAPRPETALLRLRQAVGAHANIRPFFPIESLPDFSSLRAEVIGGVDFVIVRELLGGSYFGESGRDGDKAYDIREYSAAQVEAVGRTAFTLALERAEATGRDPRVTNVDKANVLATSQLWREVIKEIHTEYPEIDLDHMYVDNAAFQIPRNPGQFDVIITENEHGDILSDGAANIPGSLGLAPSASISETGKGYWEPVHGSAPDIAGKGIANPAAMLWSVVMMLQARGKDYEASRVNWAVGRTFEQRILTPDLGGNATTEEFTQGVLHNMHGFGARR